MTWIVSSISISGVKGVLNRAGEFELGYKKEKPVSIAIFGPNGCGKSGYADAIEYMFSLDGEVKHLGKGGADSELGGKHAIPHVLAEEKGIAPEVSIEFINTETRDRLFAKRPIQTGRVDPRPGEIDTVLAQAPAYNILRQHDLRHFVVDMSPSEKFSEFSQWIGIEDIDNILTHLKTTQNTLKNAGLDREISEHLDSIRSHTLEAVSTFDLQGILNWCTAEAEKHLEKFTPQDVAKTIPELIELLNKRREEIVQQSKGARAVQTKRQLGEKAGALPSIIRKLESTFSQSLKAEQDRDQAQSEASQSVFREVWQAAQDLLNSEKPKVCPVCQTPWEKTKVGSLDDACVALSVSLDELAEFEAVSKRCLTERKNLQDTLTALDSGLLQVNQLAETLSLPQVVSQASQLHTTCEQMMKSDKNLQELTSQFTNFYSSCDQFVHTQIPQALDSMPEEVASQVTLPIGTSIANLQALNEAIQKIETLQRREAAVREVEQQFGQVADEIRTQAKALTEDAVALLRSEVEYIYKQIYPDEAVPHVHIGIDAAKRDLTFRVSFHSDDRVVPPAGYLSESQINTLGLALFLSAVRRFNKTFPFLVLDDIVSSYDADNRARIVDLLAEYMQGFQIFLTTHDERFFTHLKQRLQSENWRFDRITGYEFDLGPRRESEIVTCDEISRLINDGDSQIAGNAVRQYMEDWFDEMCAKYDAYTPHKRGPHDYQRTLFDYWEPFLTRVKTLNPRFKDIVFTSNAYKRLSAVSIINYYSHYQANPYAWPAIGDVKYVWENFIEFTKLFCCCSCGKLLKFNSDKNRLYCICGDAFFPPPATSESSD